MNASLTKLVVIAAVMSVATIAQAQGIRDAGSKIRGDYGIAPRSQSYYYSDRALNRAVVAPAPAEQRSFSLQPGRQPDAVSGCDAGAHQAALPNQPSSTAARQPATASRRFSYEPTAPVYRAAPRSDRNPTSFGIRDAGSKIRGI
jgi:hypothetical protein